MHSGGGGFELAELEVELDANTDGYHMNALLLDSLDKDKNCWLLALKANGENFSAGKGLAAVRLLWLLAQPVVCFVLFFIPAREELWSESVPAGLAVCMPVRETIYLLTTALCAYHNPAFLRVSIMASVRGKAASKEDSITAAFKITRRPSQLSETPSPTASTSPTPSEPEMAGYWTSKPGTPRPTQRSRTVWTT